MKIYKLLVFLLIIPMMTFANTESQCNKLSYEYVQNKNYINGLYANIKNKYPVLYPFLESCENANDPEACLMGNCAASALIQWMMGEEASCDNFIVDAIKAENNRKKALSNMNNLVTQYKKLGCN